MSCWPYLALDGLDGTLDRHCELRRLKDWGGFLLRLCHEYGLWEFWWCLLDVAHLIFFRGYGLDLVQINRLLLVGHSHIHHLTLQSLAQAIRLTEGRCELVMLSANLALFFFYRTGLHWGFGRQIFVNPLEVYAWNRASSRAVFLPLLLDYREIGWFVLLVNLIWWCVIVRTVCVLVPLVKLVGQRSHLQVLWRKIFTRC